MRITAAQELAVNSLRADSTDYAEGGLIELKFGRLDPSHASC